jgi:hypothetical protein
MDIKIKALAAIAPFAIAITVGSTLAYPAYQEYTVKQTTADEKKAEEEGLQQKLAGRTKLLSEKKLMEDSLQKLRGSIPKKPELELLNIDLEKMCQESGVDLVSFKEADHEQTKNLEDDPSKQLTSAQLLKNKVKGQAKTAAAASSNGGAGATANGTGTAVAGAGDTGLSKVILAVKCIGDYASIEDLVHKLETYQRVVAITELKTGIPKKVEAEKHKKLELPDDSTVAETEALGDYKRLNASFLLTTYYLP